MMKPGSRDVLLLLTSMVLASAPVGYLQVVLPLYLNRAGLEPSLIGLLYSLSGLVTAGLVAFSGTLADRPPFVAVIVLAAVATVVLLPLTETSTEPRTRSSRSGSWLPKRSFGVIARYALALGLFGLGLGVAVQLLPLWFALRFGVDE